MTINKVPNPICDFKKKFNLPELIIHRTECWTISVRPHQKTLASVVLSVNENFSRFSDLSPNHGKECIDLIGQFEKIVCLEFGAIRINVLGLMMVDPIVHFHIIPRYSRIVTRYDNDWHDTDFPSPVMLDSGFTERSILLSLRDELKDKLIAEDNTL